MKDTVRVEKVGNRVGLVFSQEKARILGLREDDELLVMPDEAGGIRLVPYDGGGHGLNGEERSFIQLPPDAFDDLDD